MRGVEVVVVLAVAVPAAVIGQEAGALTLEAVRLAEGEAVRVDGVLDEAVWSRAAVATDFRQQDPDEGAPATERTEVRVVYDRDHLYIGALLADREPSRVLGTQMERDAGLGADDRFMLILDTFLDGRTGYFFEINPAGLMGDGLLSGGGAVNKSWDGIWEARVVRGDHGWSAEIRIPFRTLNFDPSLEAWGINFQRTVRRRNEESLWSGHGRNQGLFSPAHAGRLTGVRDVSQGLGLEVTPYAVAAVEQAPGLTDAATATPADVGVDLTYSITPGLRASVTVNTDFAEAEVDQRRVNLTRFPISFPERRDFFLEGSSVYSFAASSGPTPYFSRRIGLAAGQRVPIRWGARLAGQAGAYDLGFLHVHTGGATVPDLGDASSDRVPPEQFTVARVKRNVLRESALGAIYTRRATAPVGDEAGPPDRHTAGVDLDLFTSRFRGDRNLQLEAFVVWHSRLMADDATGDWDRTARGVRLNYPNDLWRGHVSYREFGDNYRPPVGFVSRRGFRRLQPSLSYRPRPAWLAGVRQLEFGTRIEYLTDLDNRLETFGAGFTLLEVDMESGDNVEFGVSRDFERLDGSFEIYDDVVVSAGDYWTTEWEVEARTASRRPLSGDITVSRGGFWDGRRTRLRLGADLRPRPGLSIGAVWERNDVDLAGGDFATNLVRVGSGWQFSPWISLNGNVQYDDLSDVIGVFTRFRWIVRPGSDLYLVYTHNLRYGDPLDPRNVYTLERQAATKLTYTHRF
jgi:hypothetical protein